MVFMQKELSVRTCKLPSVFSCLRAIVMAASSALLIVCLSDCVIISMCMIL